ncbi:hypothetical protein Si004_00398 [Streptococcus infantarius subsp. infantarius]|nr:hypothetical protein [Streptococcus infantarius subsp. infantarius]MCO4676252.1 hypothetical protein [Streptococcus infantarius subsp. infantarius]MCO4680377.1 hypothetical protein [Streptococcus infantarius subsp. infantarius]MCO4683133.1 hypothetical protein [Streptococcus infantarius subsp. infantarius]
MNEEIRPMKVICHDLDCHCDRRREWIKVNGEWHPIEYSVADPNEPLMTEKEKENVAKIIIASMAKE